MRIAKGCDKPDFGVIFCSEFSIIRDANASLALII